MSEANTVRKKTRRIRHTAWIELKHPFQIATQASAKAPIRLPSMFTKNRFLITMATRPAMIAAMGSTFQSLWLMKKRSCLPR